MGLKTIVKRETQVAFSRHSQPVWFRVMKYILLAIAVYFLWNTVFFLPVFISLIVVSVTVHFWYRHKTDGWKKSYGMWKHETEGKQSGN